MSDPYALTPNMLAAYQQKYGAPAPAAAVSAYNAANAGYVAGFSGTGSLAGSGIPGTASPNAAAGSGYSSTPGQGNSWFGNILGSFTDTLNTGLDVFKTTGLPGVGTATTVTNAASTAASAVSNAAGIGDLLGIVTDLPRVTSIVAGLIILTAGLFMLGVKPAVQVVGKVSKVAALG